MRKRDQERQEKRRKKLRKIAKNLGCTFQAFKSSFVDNLWYARIGRDHYTSGRTKALAEWNLVRYFKQLKKATKDV